MTRRERFGRASEFLLIFVLVPVALWIARARGEDVPVLPLLAGTAGLAVVYLLRAAPAQLRETWCNSCRREELARVAFQAAAGAALLGSLVLLAFPERFLDLPQQRPLLWLGLFAIYPLLSVVPQELLFRVFFFQRYGALLGGRGRLVVASGVTFGLAHAFYGYWLTVALATLGGLCFAWTFARTRSLPLVVLEHSVYGILLFTLGLGRHFYAGLGS